VLENDPGYFLGSIICINQSTDALSVQKPELVDAMTEKPVQQTTQLFRLQGGDA
jgi:hypothetical protein